MAESRGTLDSKILELLAAARAAEQQEVTDRARADLELLNVHERDMSLNGLIATTVKAIAADFGLRESYLAEESKKPRKMRAEVRRLARIAVAADPQIRVPNAKKVLILRNRGVHRPAQAYETPLLFSTEPEFIGQDSVQQGWLVRYRSPGLRPAGSAQSYEIATFTRAIHVLSGAYHDEDLHTVQVRGDEASITDSEGERPPEQEQYFVLGLLLAAHVELDKTISPKARK